MTQKNISQLFNQFAGREVPMTEQCVETRNGGYTLVKPANEKDPTIEDMKRVAEDNGLILRVSFPGMMSAKDYRLDRVNVFIERDGEGKYRVGNNRHSGKCQRQWWGQSDDSHKTGAAKHLSEDKNPKCIAAFQAPVFQRFLAASPLKGRFKTLTCGICSFVQC
ncbi:MAG: hypothetical protein HY052_04280 [Proteobacteria bacterium]|nr:hypothetical protein [Pseudomonadota bacterium]